MCGNPKLLQCNHVDCFDCLIELMTPDQQGQPFLTCPSCGQATPLPTMGKPMENQLLIINSALAELDMRCGEICDQKAALEVDIHDSFRHIHEDIDIR